MQSARILGLNLIELEDWNCCGSSSAQTFSQDLSLGLAARNLSLVPAGRPSGGDVPALSVLPAPDPVVS